MTKQVETRVWTLWVCDKERCAEDGGQEFFSSTEPEPRCPRCDGTMTAWDFYCLERDLTKEQEAHEETRAERDDAVDSNRWHQRRIEIANEDRDKARAEADQLRQLLREARGSVDFQRISAVAAAGGHDEKDGLLQIPGAGPRLHR